MTRLKRLKYDLREAYDQLQYTENEIETINKEIDEYKRQLEFLEEDRFKQKNRVERLEQNLATIEDS